ncbi:hypothetical protein EDD76_10556 [Kineothrix alysoides]|uniref:Uncharacterized protein n=1 Tax=Kineothrix alysoides TaxID=1469948 RepID=A0A4R1R0S2_9FIRM|nr:DUF5688 family protein [Kineothrix alysoides]TCL58886.1 hypothetical protein EDD76_10556 [Kineothrix alysoides]
MNYTEFKNYVREHILENLPEKYADSNIQIEEIVKNNDCFLDGLQIGENGSNMTPIICLDDYFKEYENGRSMESILQAIAEIRMDYHIPKGFDSSIVTDWEKVKDKVICKLVNAEKNEKFLKNKPFTQIEDLAVIYLIILEEREEGSFTITIHNGLLEGYGIDKETLHQTALSNMEQLMPALFSTLQEVVKELLIPDIAKQFEVEEELIRGFFESTVPESGIPMYCLTNKARVNGAACILNTKVQKQIAKQLGGDFYMIPSSIHETLIVPKTADIDFRELETMVQEVNLRHVSVEERLSDYIYEYNTAKHELVRCDKVIGENVISIS